MDLADYATCPAAGNLIAGKRDTFSVNLSPPGPGLLTSVRSGLAGSLEDRFREALRRAREFNAAVIAEPEFPADFSVREGAWEVYVNDRLGFPNTDPTDRLVRPAVAAALGIAPELLTRDPDSRNRAGILGQVGGRPVVRPCPDQTGPRSARTVTSATDPRPKAGISGSTRSAIAPDAVVGAV